MSEKEIGCITEGDSVGLAKPNQDNLVGRHGKAVNAGVYAILDDYGWLAKTTPTDDSPFSLAIMQTMRWGCVD